MNKCKMGYEVQDDLIPPERCPSDGHSDSCKDCRNYKEYNRGLRANLNNFEDFGIEPEEFDKIVEALNGIPN